MVHWQNVEYILQNGLCCREHLNADPNYINIGMRQLIEDRHAHPVNLTNGGNLGEYIPFYFAGQSPMLYLIKTGRQGVVQLPQDDIVFLVCNVKSILDSKLDCFFTDRNAKMKLCNSYTQFEDLDKLHWDCIYTKDWANDSSNLARRDYKQAEFLIRHHLPIDYISVIVVKSEERKAYLEDLIHKFGLDIFVHVDINCKLYY